MDLVVKKSEILLGSVIPPSSKSQSIRGILFALLAKGKSTLTNVLDADDVQDAINVCRLLGVEIETDNNTLQLTSLGLPINITTDKIYSGNSGITTHFIMPILGLRKNALTPIILDCGEQMRARPIKPLVDSLNNLGLHIQYLKTPGTLPLSISGSLQGGETEVSGITSQYLSALLMALPCASKDSRLIVTNLQERPYVEMTLDWLRRQNIVFTHEQLKNKDYYSIDGGQEYTRFERNITGDFSSASYLIAAAVLSQSRVELTGLCMLDHQGDKELVNILQKMGANIIVEPDKISIQGGRKLQGIKIDASDIPDLLPTLAVIGTFASGKTEIMNVMQARVKETDRIHSMAEGLRHLGAKIEEHEDGLTIYESSLRGARVRGYGDHRTVMALSLAGMRAEGTTFIDDAEAINKTFPKFVEMMCLLGANMKTENLNHG